GRGETGRHGAGDRDAHDAAGWKLSALAPLLDNALYLVQGVLGYVRDRRDGRDPDAILDAAHLAIQKLNYLGEPLLYVPGPQDLQLLLVGRFDYVGHEIREVAGFSELALGDEELEPSCDEGREAGGGVGSGQEGGDAKNGDEFFG